MILKNIWNYTYILIYKNYNKNTKLSMWINCEIIDKNEKKINLTQ